MSDISFSPAPPAPGSNAFGRFAFGVSPFGTIAPFDWRATVISQYADSPVLLSVIAAFADAMDQTRSYDLFFDQVWNVDTAVGWGLDVWGRIVGVSRNLQVANANYWGFQQGLFDNFGPGGVSPFYSGQPVTSVYALTDAAYRQLILAKAAYNVCDGSIPATNAVLMFLFGPGNQFGPGGDCYVTDGLNMSMTYTFTFLLSPLQSAIVFQSGVLPKPVGVSVTVVQ